LKIIRANSLGVQTLAFVVGYNSARLKALFLESFSRSLFLSKAMVDATVLLLNVVDSFAMNIRQCIFF
jgi:hypothetical protein